MKRSKKTISAEQVPQACDMLAELGVRRNHYIRAVIRETNATQSLVRRALGFQWDMSEAERNKINKRAGQIIRRAFDVVAQSKDDEPIVAVLQAELQTLILMCGPPSTQREAVEKEMKRLARSLPVWEWAKDVKGLSDLGLAVIIAEAGDISRYSTKDKLKKRLGLAPITKDGVTRACSQWRSTGGLTADDWKDQGPNGPKYKPRRRAAMYSQIGTQIIGGMGKGHRPLVGEDISLRTDWSYYEKLFVERLRIEAQKNPDHIRPATEAGKESYSKHAKFMAQRYVEQRLLKHLWQAWRQAIVGIETRRGSPAATTSAQADPPANLSLKSSRIAPGDSHSALEAERSAIARASTRLELPSVPIPAKAGKRRAIEQVKSARYLPVALPSADEAERSANHRLEAISEVPSARIHAQAEQT